MGEKYFKGLSFNYYLDGNKTKLIAKYKTIKDFLEEEFPKNNNPMSPKYNTEIFDIKWNGHRVSINENAKTVNDLKKILSDDCYISNRDIRLTKYTHDKTVNRKSIHTIEEIRELTKDVLFERDKQKAKVELDGDIIKGNSQRYQLFFSKGTKCVCCGIEGKYFAKEKHKKDKLYHLNLYGVDNDGHEILITKDHILPKSMNGNDNLENYQTMCLVCNNLKGNKLY